MTTALNQRRLDQKFTRAAALCLLALAAVLCHSHEARAQWTTSGTNTTTTSNVGVGTAAPVTSLHVSTATTAIPRGITNEQTSADNNAALYVFRKSRAGAMVQNGDNIGNLYAEAFDGASFLSPARLRFTVDGPVSANSIPTSLQFFTGTNSSGVERMRISSAGNIGIGTTTPGSLLNIQDVSSGSVRGFMIDQVITGTHSALLGLRKARGVPGALTAVLNGDALANIRASAYDGTNYLNNAQIQAIVNGTVVTNSVPTDLLFSTGSSGVAERMRITSGGNIGIGTAMPATALHVVGDITVTGNINAKYQDVAEWVPSSQKLAVGTVVVVDAGGTNQVLASSSAYDTSVAGVITGQPGLLLGEGGEGKVKVATTGRVKVRVDATRAPVRAGDLLVTSEVPGVAMRSEPVSFAGVPMHRPGTIIGKALEPLAKGTGEILVLLSLQ